MYERMTYAEAVAKADHLIALGETEVFIEPEGAPWHNVTSVKSGAGYRFNGPTGVWIIAQDAGLTFKWSVDFEGRDANGRGVSLFDRPRLRHTVMLLPPDVRPLFAEFLAEKVLPDLEKRTQELRDAMNQQMDSEDCVRGLIAYAGSAVNG
jgi:hypothetical protein